jgi:fucose permease
MVSLLLVVIYLAFISLGLPDPLLGAAWPTAYTELGVPLGWSGIIFMLISSGTVISSLQSDRLTRKLGTGVLTSLSVMTTAVALFGFSVSHSFWELCLWAVPYGLGAGSVDAALNNYVALHYASRHMSWLHCMWGVGTTLGPMILSLALTGGHGWNMGYRYIFFLQLGLTVILMLSLPMWKKQSPDSEDSSSDKPLSLRGVLSLKGAKDVMACFFCYCAIEQAVSLWASSYLVKVRNIDEVTAAKFAGLFFIGITAGRAASGFATFRFTDKQMVRIGEGVIALGVLLMLLPFGSLPVLIGLVTVGVGCAPIYPSVIHSTPDHFGASRSQAVIGVEMASAYVGTTLMPPIMGFIASFVGLWIFPFFLLLMLLMMFVTHERLCAKTEDHDTAE